MEPKNVWPMVVHRHGELAIKYDVRSFCRWSSAVAKKSASHISSTWHDIECTNFLIDRAYSSLCDLHRDTSENIKEIVRQEQMWIHILEMLSLSMYRDLHIICKIIEKDEEAFKKICDLEGYRQLKNRVIEIRNWLIEHKDKPNFYTQLASSWTSFASGTDLAILVDAGERGRREIQIKPLTDAESMRLFLDIALAG